MPSDPSYGTTGFFSYLWVKRKPVYDFPGVTELTDDAGQFILTDDAGTSILVADDAGLPRLIRWI